MICPYNRKSETTTELWERCIDGETGNATNGITKTKTVFSMMKCPQEGCGAWQNGKCGYASVNLNNE